MTDIQQKALDLYLESATLENGYKVATFKEISDKLKTFDLQASKSTIQRWSVAFEFEKHLEKKLQTIMVDEDDYTPEQNALAKVYKTDKVTVERNSALMNKAYSLLEEFMDDIADQVANQKVVHKDDKKLVKEIAILTAGRDDKLLDRLASNSGDTLSSVDIKETLLTIDVEIEE